MLQEDRKELKSYKDIGSGVLVHAHVPDTSRVFIDVGLGFFAETKLHEACTIMGRRVPAFQLQKEKDAAVLVDIEGHIKIVTESLRALDQLS